MSGRFSIVKKGYDIAEVDNYVRTLENVVKSYKEKDAAIKNAILHAQIAGDSIINEAKEYSRNLVGDTIRHMGEVRNAVTEQMRSLDSFVSDYNYLMDKYFTKIAESDFEALRNKLANLEEYYIRMSEKNLTLTSKLQAETEAKPEEKQEETLEKLE